MHVDRSIGATAPMTEREIITLVHRTIAHAASDQSGLIIGAIEVNLGWGDIFFVRVKARLADQSAREQLEQRLASAVREALEGQRTSVSVSWTG